MAVPLDEERGEPPQMQLDLRRDLDRADPVHGTAQVQPGPRGQQVRHPGVPGREEPHRPAGGSRVRS